MDRSVEFAIGAAVLAADDAKLALDEEDFGPLWYSCWYWYWRY